MRKNFNSHNVDSIRQLFTLHIKKTRNQQQRHTQSYTRKKFFHCMSHNLNSTDFSNNHRKMSVFKFNDYDCVGFDLDNTLLSYDINNMVRLEYELMAKFMIEKRGYDAAYLGKPLLDKDIDFLQKGLILDFDAGNILKLDSEGVIIRASHGTKMLTLEEIKNAYPDQRWEATDSLVKNTLESWNGPVSLKLRSLLDFFDMPSSLIFARAVDSLDSAKSNIEVCKKCYTVWSDVLDSLTDMFSGKNFKSGEGGYFSALRENPEKYMKKCDNATIAWLRELKRKKVTFLVTGSYADFANFTASYSLGEDWRSLFDIVICFARKPGFFTGDRPFVTLSEYEESETLAKGKLSRGGMYSQGNWAELKNFFGKICNNDEPRCLYAGDNLIQDIYVPGAHINCDTVVLSEELYSETNCDQESRHPYENILNSRFWGSYFYHYDSANRVDTLWCGMIKKYSKICIPSMTIIAHRSIDEPYKCFDKSDPKSNGFYPEEPRRLSLS